MLSSFFNRLVGAGSLDAVGVNGETCLTQAVKLGNIRCVETYLDAGAHPHKPNARGEYPIFLAFDRKDEAVSVLLLSAGIPLDAKKDGLSLRAYASRCGLRGLAADIAYIERSVTTAALSAAFAPTPVYIPLNTATPFGAYRRFKK